MSVFANEEVNVRYSEYLEYHNELPTMSYGGNNEQCWGFSEDPPDQVQQ